MQAKLMRLALDSGAADGEALCALSKLRENLRNVPISIKKHHD